jgi:spermidine/putrescine transport system substrate-binding protein
MNTISRRTLMQMMGAGAAALGTPFGKAGMAFAARGKEMNILCWEGYNSAQVLDPFRKKENATVKAETLNNDPAMINRLRAGETNIWDVINVNNPWARKVLWPEELIGPLPREKFEPYFDKMLAARAATASRNQTTGTCSTSSWSPASIHSRSTPATR